MELQKQGISNLYEAQNEVLDGIRFVSKYLTQGTFKICLKCKNLIKEFQSYVWDSKSLLTGVDKPLKENDHALDALRYALYSHFFGKDLERVSAEDLDNMYNETRGIQAHNMPRFFQEPIETPNVHIPRF